MTTATEPLVFGEADERTRAQLTRCLELEDGARGVLCADNHVGYAMPIGGVAAYREHVSVNGVGYDIACFAGSTRVFTLDGTTPTLAELAGRDDLFVLASAENGSVIPARASCSLTRRGAALVDVEIDNGETIRCTPDHLFMARDGSYVEAGSLSAGASLMPLYSTLDDRGYVRIRNNKTLLFDSLHWLVFRSGLTAPAPDLNGDRLVIHHVDFNPTNNDPLNLRPMRRKDHDTFHAACRDKAHLNTPEFTANRLLAIGDFWERARKDAAFMEKRAETARANARKAPPEQRRARAAGNGQRGRKYLIEYNKSPETIRKNRERGGQPRECPECGARVTATSSLYYHTRREHASPDNHKVVAVTPVDAQEDVYCLVVPGHNNFALAAGVFVHNCGNCAVRTDVLARDVDVARAMDEVAKVISFGVGRNNEERIDDHPVYELIDKSPIKPQRLMLQMARNQLGTVGSGNHYVDLFEDRADGHLWIGVHFGSRGFGHKTACGFLALADGQLWDGKVRDDMDAPPTLLRLDSQLGQDYMAAMAIAGKYAYAGRDWVVDRVLRILGAQQAALSLDTTVPRWHNGYGHNHHNFAWLEPHDGDMLCVVRKGATPAMPGQLGFIGGSMGEDAVIVEGVESPLSAASFYSTVHGAGRVMGRKAAAGKTRRVAKWRCRDYRKCDFAGAKGGFHVGPNGETPTCPKCGHKLRLESTVEQVSPGLIDWPAAQEAVRAAGIELRGAGADEAPGCYKRLPDVLAAHAGTIRVLHQLRVVGAAMAGAEVDDPYRD